ncbi:substrate-binding periplasmic protein [Bdellovibrio sp. HCB209]|uniref:substrate-binding periplasmic protein n=1 Tax=Bdellovibrio sp. HCB209 TaxID=3394354 RepID=UPI0039B39805
MQYRLLFVLILCFVSMHAQAAKPRVLRVAAVQGPPHVTNAESEQPSGSAPDFMRKYVFPELKKKFNMDVVWKSSPFKREQRDLEMGNIDMLFLVLKTPEREKIFDYSAEPFLEEQPGVIVAKDFQKGKTSVSVKEFAGKTVGQMAGAVVADPFTKQGTKVIFLTGEDIGERLSNLVETHRIDGVFIHLSSITEDIVERNKFVKLKSVQIHDMASYKVWIAYSKKLEPEIKAEIDRLISANRKHYRASLPMPSPK